MNRSIPAQPSRRPANYITAEVSPKYKHEHSVITLIVDAEVHRIPVKDEENIHVEYYDVMMEHWQKPDVYISLENRNGVTIREAEKQGGYDVRTGYPSEGNA